MITKTEWINIKIVPKGERITVTVKTNHVGSPVCFEAENALDNTCSLHNDIASAIARFVTSARMASSSPRRKSRAAKLLKPE